MDWRERKKQILVATAELQLIQLFFFCGKQMVGTELVGLKPDTELYDILSEVTLLELLLVPPRQGSSE